MKREVLSFKQKEWNKFSLEKQEQLCKEFDVRLPDYMTRKDKALWVLNRIDFSTPEGKAAYDWAFNKADDIFKKVDNVFDKIDEATEKLEKGLGDVGKGFGDGIGEVGSKERKKYSWEN